MDLHDKKISDNVGSIYCFFFFFLNEGPTTVLKLEKEEGGGTIAVRPERIHSLKKG